jgi:hypothetical protein
MGRLETNCCWPVPGCHRSFANPPSAEYHPTGTGTRNAGRRSEPMNLGGPNRVSCIRARSLATSCQIAKSPSSWQSQVTIATSDLLPVQVLQKRKDVLSARANQIARLGHSDFPTDPEV